MRRKLLTLAAIFGGVALLLSAIAGLFHAIDRSFVSRSAPAEGVVVAIEARNFRRGLHALVEFEADGRRVRFHESVGGVSSGRAIGERLPVLYERGNPDNAMVDSYWNHHLVPTILGIIAGPFLLASLVVGLVALVKGGQAT